MAQDVASRRDPLRLVRQRLEDRGGAALAILEAGGVAVSRYLAAHVAPMSKPNGAGRRSRGRITARFASRQWVRYVPPDTTRRDAMRMLLKATMDTQMANHALQEGTMQQRLQEVMERFQPEASYFYAEDGKRASVFILEMEDPSQIPPVVEPFFLTAGASIHLTPVMNGEDLQKGLQEAFG